MTWEEFNHLKWQCELRHHGKISHYSVRSTVHEGHSFAKCLIAPTMEYRASHPHSHNLMHFFVDGKVYQSKKKLLEAIENL